MGERSLSNAFARFYYINETRGFEKWKDYVALQKHKEKVIRRTIEHWRKHMWNFTKAVFKNWIQKARIHETSMTLNHTAMLSEEAVQLNRHRAELHSDQCTNLRGSIEDATAKTELYNERLGRIVGGIINRND